MDCNKNSYVPKLIKNYHFKVLSPQAKHKIMKELDKETFMSISVDPLNHKDLDFVLIISELGFFIQRKLS
jgi:hypothetical protein